MTSLLGRITEEHIHEEPFPYVMTTEALAPEVYESLASRFPAFPPRDDLGRNNTLAHISGLHAFADEIPVDPVWQDFMRFHYSTAFFRQIVARLGDGVRRCFPDLEERLGKSLDALTVQPRNTDDVGADLWVDVQFAINTPVREASRVRGRHVDSPKKLFAGLFYMRAPDDDSEGGDLEICRWRDGAEPQLRSVAVLDPLVDVVDTVKYRANTLMLFVNSPHSVHGVTTRLPTPHLRRYINLIAEFREPIYDIGRYQDSSQPWALLPGGGFDDDY